MRQEERNLFIPSCPSHCILILTHFILSYLILSYPPFFILFYLTLSHLILSILILSYSPPSIDQGYLLERSSAKLLVQHTWNREWFVLDDTKLYVIKEKERDWVSSLDAQVQSSHFIACSPYDAVQCDTA